MDEYTLLLVAKLNADRKKLEREGRVTQSQPARPEPRNTQPRDSTHVSLGRFLAWR